MRHSLLYCLYCLTLPQLSMIGSQFSKGCGDCTEVALVGSQFQRRPLTVLIARPGCTASVPHRHELQSLERRAGHVERGALDEQGAPRRQVEKEGFEFKFERRERGPVALAEGAESALSPQ